MSVFVTPTCGVGVMWYPHVPSSWSGRETETEFETRDELAVVNLLLRCFRQSSLPLNPEEPRHSLSAEQTVALPFEHLSGC